MRLFLAFASLCLVCLLAIVSRAQAENPVPAGNHPIQANHWSFQCMYGLSECGPGGNAWINTTSQPGAVRLWDSGTNWALLETGPNTYSFANLDQWLDLIAEHHPTAAIYTFGHVPCWLSTATCTGNGWGSGQNWSPGPPNDLTSSGSPTFTAFVTELTKHCSPAGHCVKDYIKFWEMWNEANLSSYWTGSAAQLYDMFKPVIPIIRANVPGAKISTPPVCGGDGTWMASWMTLENSNGRLSDYYGFHVYLESDPPETRINMVERMVNIKNQNGWTTTPWMNTETNFINTSYSCSTQYSPADCQGQIVRWHVLQYAYQGGAGGAIHVGWYNWEGSIPSGGYDTYYYTMMQWLNGASFSTSCTSSGTVWTCPLTEANGASALIVWNSAGDSQYTPAAQYIDYKKFNGTYGGATETISKGESTTIGVSPILFESK